MRSFVVCALFLLAVAHAEEVMDPAKVNAPIEDVVFGRWCKASAITEYETALTAYNAKHEAYIKAAGITANLSTKYDAAKEALTSHLEAIAKTKHRIAVLERRTKRTDAKKAKIKRALNPQYDLINWATEKAHAENVITSLSGLHDKTTNELVKSTLRNYIIAITRTQRRVAAFEARVDAFDKEKRDYGSTLNTYQSHTSRLNGTHSYSKKAYEDAKKFSDAAEQANKDAQEALTTAGNNVNACVNKGHLPPSATVDAAKHIRAISRPLPPDNKTGSSSLTAASGKKPKRPYKVPGHKRQRRRRRTSRTKRTRKLRKNRKVRKNRKLRKTRKARKPASDE